jgi:hypothetical protein
MVAPLYNVSQISGTAAQYHTTLTKILPRSKSVKETYPATNQSRNDLLHLPPRSTVGHNAR